MPNYSVEVHYETLSGSAKSAIFVLSAPTMNEARDKAVDRVKNDGRRNVYRVPYTRCVLLK